jgi:hypothetical protein
MSVRLKTITEIASPKVPTRPPTFRLVHPELEWQYAEVLLLRKRLRAATDQKKKRRRLDS